MNYIIEWDLSLIKTINNSFPHSQWDFIDSWGLILNSQERSKRYLFIHGSWKREDFMTGERRHFMPPRIRIEEIERGDKAWFKKSVKEGSLICLSKNITIDALKELHNFEYDKCRDNHTLIPECIKPYIIKASSLEKMSSKE